MTSLYRVGDLDEALKRANAVEFGLSAAIFTQSLESFATSRSALPDAAGVNIGLIERWRSFQIFPNLIRVEAPEIGHPRTTLHMSGRGFR